MSLVTQIDQLEKQKQKLITINNKRFKNLSKQQKAIEVAKDILDLIKDNQIKVDQGTWLDLSNINNDKPQESLLRLSKENDCRCCAMGSCLLSAIRLGNNIKYLEDSSYIEESSYNTEYKLLLKVFNQNQLSMIECAFEKGGGGFDYDDRLSDVLVDKCIKFGQKYRTPKLRLIAIMKNIIKNKGEFKP
jgi:hypothetical protein